MAAADGEEALLFTQQLTRDVLLSEEQHLKLADALQLVDMKIKFLPRKLGDLTKHLQENQMSGTRQQIYSRSYFEVKEYFTSDISPR